MALLTTKTAFWRMTMFRLLKALPVTLAIAALSLFTSCSSSSHTQIRVINAIPDAQGALDVDFNGNKITGTTPLAFGSIFPATNPPATYASEPSGSGTITAYVTGTTVNPVNNGNSSFNSSTEYTVVLQGFAAANNTPAVLTDNNTAPAANTLEYRVINASPSSPGGSVDVYIYQSQSSIPASPQISGLTLGQGFYVQSLPYSSSSGYTVVVTAHGAGNQGIAYVNQNYTPANGSITTLVLVDNSPENGLMSSFPLAFSDLN